jgi:hypothetical protein
VTRRAILLVAVLVVSVGAVAGVATAETPYADPANVCEDRNQQLVVLLANGEHSTDQLAVFTGTELRVVHCSAESGGNPAETTDAWGISGGDGLEVVATNERSVTLRAVGPLQNADLAERVEQKAADETTAPTLTVVEPGGTDTGAIEQPSEVRFGDQATRTEFVDAREAYSTAVAEAESLTARLDDAAAADDPVSALGNTSVRAVDDRVAAVENASANKEQLFLDAAVNGDDDATVAFLAQQDHSEGVVADLDAAADSYVAAVESRATDARLLVTGALLGPFVVGVLAGAVGGGALSRRDLKQVRQQRRRDRTVEYSLGTLWKVFVGATVAVVAGVAVVLVGADLGRIITVMT